MKKTTITETNRINAPTDGNDETEGIERRLGRPIFDQVLRACRSLASENLVQNVQPTDHAARKPNQLCQEIDFGHPTKHDHGHGNDQQTHAQTLRHGTGGLEEVGRGQLEPHTVLKLYII